MTTATGVKPAAIWARVSKKSQDEISPSTQISRCQILLQSKGYIATKIFNVNHCSLDLDSCTEFQQLQNMVDHHEINAIAIYNRDRLEAIPVQRIMFLAQLKKAGVEVLICDGPPLLEGSEGQLVEFALTMGKEQSVYRARNGSRTGLHDRVHGTDKHSPRPANHRKIYGYDWNIPLETLTPNQDYPTLELIFDLAMAGNGYARIKKELEKKGIASPYGRIWGKGNLSKMIHCPVYAGRFYGLKTRTLRGEKPGTRLQLLPESEWTFIPEVKIEKSPITWEQRQILMQQIQKHIALSSRHANRQYLCRGMIECEEHLSVKGKHLIYHGRPWHDSFGYICPGSGKPHHFIQGEPLERAVKSALKYLFSIADSQLWQHVSGIEKINRSELEADFKKHQVKLQKAIQNEAIFEIRALDMKQDVYELARAKLRVQRLAIEEGLAEIQKQLDNSFQIEEKVEALKDIRVRFLKNTRGFSDKQWRALLEELDCRIRITPKVKADENEGFLSESINVKKTIDGIANYASFPLPEFNAYMFLKLPRHMEARKIASIGLPTPSTGNPRRWTISGYTTW
jgi:hypothetical protein